MMGKGPVGAVGLATTGEWKQVGEACRESWGTRGGDRMEWKEGVKPTQVLDHFRDAFVLIVWENCQGFISNGR